LTKKQKQKKQRPLVPVCMTVVGMNLLAMTFAAAGFAAANRLYEYASSPASTVPNLFIISSSISHPRMA